MKKYLKILCMIAIFILMIGVLENLSMAYDWESKLNSTWNNSANYDTTGASTSVKNLAGTIITITRVIAVGIAIIMLIVLAIKYLLAAPGDKADIKKHSTTYIVGAVILFATSGLLTIIQKFASGF